jgi:tape measure domain-containing protein
MANDIVVRFIGEDNITTVANKAAASINKVTNATQDVTKNTKVWQAASGVMENQIAALGGAVGSMAMQVGASAGPYGIAAAAIISLGAGFLYAADSASKYNDTVKALKQSVVQLAASNAEGEKLYSTLIDIAARTPFEQQDVIEMGRAFLSAGISADKVPGYIYAVGDAITTMRGSGKDAAQAIESSTRAIARMYMADKITMEQMTVLTEAGIPAWKLLAEATGYTVQELMDLSSKGLLPAAGNMDILTQAMEKSFGGAMAQQIGTVTQSASNMNDAWNKVVSNFGEAVSPSMVRLYEGITRNIVALDSFATKIYAATGRTIDWANSINASIPTWRSLSDSIINATREQSRYIRLGAEASWDSTVLSLVNAWDDVTAAISDSYTGADTFLKALYRSSESLKIFKISNDYLIDLKKSMGEFIDVAVGMDEVRDATDKVNQGWKDLKTTIDGVGASISTAASHLSISEDTWLSWRNWANDLRTWWPILSVVAEGMYLVGGVTKAATADIHSYSNGAAQAARESDNLSFWTSALVSDVDDAAGSFKRGANGAQQAAQEGDNLSKVMQKQAWATLIVKDETDKKTESTKDSSEADREAARALAELTRNTNNYNDRIKDLRGSYMDIADAQRAVESAQKDLQDAMDPNRVLSLNLSIKQQAIDMRDLNESMADMKKRRDEIARAIAGMNEQQIRNNALTAAERQQLNGLNANLDNLKKRREAVRKALAGNTLTDQQRIEFMQTEQALTAAINEKGGQRQTLVEKQAQAVKDAAEERIRLLEEDKKLQGDIEKSQIRMQQAIIAMTESQRELSEAQDPKRLEEYRDAVTKAKLNLAELRAEQVRDKVAADELASTLGVTSESFNALAESAGLTATPLDDVALRSDSLSSNLGGFNGTTALVGGLAGQMANLAADSGDAVGGVNGVGNALKSINNMGLKATVGTTLSDIGDGISSLADANGKFTTDFLSAPLQSVQDLVNALDSTKATAFTNWADALQTAITAVTDSDKVKKLINTLTALGNATSGTKNPLPYPGFSAPNPGTGGIPDMSKSSTQNITINLHYASAPSSKNPLKDVEDYLAAQGGRLRI